MTVGEYRDKFVQLSRYAPEEVNTDAKKQYKFMRGLADPLQYQLMNHSFPNFQHLVDRALMTENKRREMEEKKRKLHPTSFGSNSRPRLSGPQQNYQSRPNGGQFNSGQRTNYQGPRPNHQGQLGAPQQTPHQGTPAPRQNAPAGTPMKAGTPVPPNGCFTCGDPNH